MTYLMAVSKSGKNAKTATNPNDFIFHSEYNTFKILSTGTLTNQTVSADPSTFQIAHGKSYTPMVAAFAEFPSGHILLPNERAKNNFLDRYWTLEVNATYIYFKFWKNSTANYNVNIRYYIFEAPGN